MDQRMVRAIKNTTTPAMIAGEIVFTKSPPDALLANLRYTQIAAPSPAKNAIKALLNIIENSLFYLIFLLILRDLVLRQMLMHEIQLRY